MKPKSANKFLPAVATMSLGNAKLHALDKKLVAASHRGFLGIELYWQDLVHYAWQHRQKDEDGLERNQATKDYGEMPLKEMLEDHNWKSITKAAKEIGERCETLGLQVVCLQPLRNFDALFNEKLHLERLCEFHLWMDVADAVGTNVIGVPSTLPPATMAMGYTGNYNFTARNMQDLATLAKPRSIRIAYENMCFAEHIHTWQQALDIVRLADQENLTFLPDVFNICGENVMDPAAEECLKEEGEGTWNLDELSQLPLWGKLSVKDIPLLQVADAERPETPLTPDHPWREGGKISALMAQSRNARQFPFEKGYLPVIEVIKRLVTIGWSGWVSMETSSRLTLKEGDETIEEHADRAWFSWERVAAAMKWDVRPKLVEDRGSEHEVNGQGVNGEKRSRPSCHC